MRQVVSFQAVLKAHVGSAGVVADETESYSGDVLSKIGMQPPHPQVQREVLRVEKFKLSAYPLSTNPISPINNIFITYSLLSVTLSLFLNTKKYTRNWKAAANIDPVYRVSIVSKHAPNIDSFAQVLVYDDGEQGFLHRVRWHVWDIAC